jgi:hypothetical protein
MSTINTNGIDVNYPVPGQNNNTQGFRNNFTAIRQNLNTAGAEITDLQNKVVLKTALANSVLNNDMANTLIANASTLQFRATTYNLGNALVDNVLVDCSLGDLQYGNLSGNVLLTFGSWAPTNTQSTIKLQLGRPNNQADFTITLPSEAVIDQNSGWTLLENSGSNANLATITFPYDVTQIDLTLTSTDCGNTIYVQPTNRPYKTTQIQLRTPSPVGYLGDVAGTVAVDEDYLYVCTDSFDATTITGNAVTTTTGTNLITFDTNVQSAGVVANMPVVFDTMFINGNSVTSFGNITAGALYFVKTVSTTTITISDSRSGGVAGSTLALTTQAANSSTYMDATFYDGTDIWKRVALTSW